MTGVTQSQPSATWDITKLEVIEDPTALAPSNIVPVDTPFDLQVTFGGKGIAWKSYEASKLEYQVEFFVEAKTVDCFEGRIGMVTGQLDPSNPPEYKVPCHIDPAALPPTLPNPLAVGVYDLTCVVTFPTMHGMVGFIEGVLMQVYQP